MHFLLPEDCLMQQKNSFAYYLALLFLNIFQVMSSVCFCVALESALRKDDYFIFLPC